MSLYMSYYCPWCTLENTPVFTNSFIYHVPSHVPDLRPKWQQNVCNTNVGDLLLVVDPATMATWYRFTKVFPGANNITVRTLFQRCRKTVDNVYRRRINHRDNKILLKGHLYILKPDTFARTFLPS